jgi:hypothetical protein
MELMKRAVSFVVAVAAAFALSGDASSRANEQTVSTTASSQTVRLFRTTFDSVGGHRFVLTLRVRFSPPPSLTRSPGPDPGVLWINEGRPLIFSLAIEYTTKKRLLLSTSDNDYWEARAYYRVPYALNVRRHELADVRTATPKLGYIELFVQSLNPHSGISFVGSTHYFSSTSWTERLYPGEPGFRIPRVDFAKWRAVFRSRPAYIVLAARGDPLGTRADRRPRACEGYAIALKGDGTRLPLTTNVCSKLSRLGDEP